MLKCKKSVLESSTQYCMPVITVRCSTLARCMACEHFTTGVHEHVCRITWLTIHQHPSLRPPTPAAATVPGPLLHSTKICWHMASKSIQRERGPCFMNLHVDTLKVIDICLLLFFLCLVVMCNFHKSKFMTVPSRKNCLSERNFFVEHNTERFSSDSHPLLINATLCWIPCPSRLKKQFLSCS